MMLTSMPNRTCLEDWLLPMLSAGLITVAAWLSLGS
jgi:hypothetical protein